jgi:hypothetical protein
MRSDAVPGRVFLMIALDRIEHEYITLLPDQMELVEGDDAARACRISE